jgi:hypothetical protein
VSGALLVLAGRMVRSGPYLPVLRSRPHHGVR